MRIINHEIALREPRGDTENVERDTVHGTAVLEAGTRYQNAAPLDSVLSPANPDPARLRRTGADGSRGKYAAVMRAASPLADSR